MNLFWKNLFGGLRSTEKFEQEMSRLKEDMQHYAVVERSVELEEYNALAHVVNTPDFLEKKKTLQNRKYRDTEEYRDQRKYDALNKKADIRQYYNVLRSAELKEFLAFLETPEATLLHDASALKASDKLRALKRFSTSKEYKVYTRLHGSYIIKEYEELKEKVSSDEFKQRNAFWADKNRWLQTPEHKQLCRFLELKKNPDIAFFLSARPERFNRWRAFAETFADEFDWNVLSKSNWGFGFHHNHPALIGDHSYTDEQQANNSGRNISVVNGTLHIATRKEHVKARAWDAAKGFVEKDFEYTSDVMQSADKIRQQYGVFQAKIRCTGNINHACWLGTDKKLPIVKLFHFDGKALRLGSTDDKGSNETVVTGLNPAKFHVYTLVWSDKEIIWFINNMEVHRTSTQVPQEEMYIVFNSFITQTQRPQEGALEVDWVRVSAN